MHKSLFAAFAAAAVLATAAVAQDREAQATQAEASAAPETAAQEAEQDKEEKICRTEKVTGSLTRRQRICMTRAEWDAVHGKTRDAVGRIQGSAAGGAQCRQDAMGGC